MKTAVSLPDELFGEAEKLAKRLRLSRSGLFARALREFVARHRGREITASLNRVADVLDTRLPDGLRHAQTRALGRERW